MASRLGTRWREAAEFFLISVRALLQNTKGVLWVS